MTSARLRWHKLGACLVLDETDVLIAEEFPSWYVEPGTFRKIIWLSQTGHCERAIWRHVPTSIEPIEYGLWTCQLEESELKSVRRGLEMVSREFRGFACPRKSDDRGRRLRFWDNQKEIDVYLTEPPGNHCSPLQIQTFEAAWATISGPFPAIAGVNSRPN